jgi:hypothetical protein
MLIVEWIIFGMIPGFLINTFNLRKTKINLVNETNKPNTKIYGN